MLRHYRLAVALLLATTAVAQEPPAPAPRLTLETREVPLGTLLEGATVERRVIIDNTGGAPLVLTHVEPSCGCTVPGALPPPIPPGGRAELAVRFDSTGRRGPQRLALWLYSNDLTQTDKGRGCTEVTLMGDVRSLFRLQPEGAFFGEVVRTGAAREVHVMITAEPAAAGPFAAPRLVGEPPEGLDVSLAPALGPDGRPLPGVARLTVRLRPDAPPGELARDVLIETGVPEQPRLTVPVIALISARVAGPRAIELFDVRRASGTTRRVPLERRDGRTDGIPVREVMSPLPWLRARVEPVSGARVDLVVEVLPDAPAGAFAAVIEVHLDDRHEPLLRVPVLGEVLPRVQIEPGAVLLAPGESATVLVRGGRVRDVKLKPPAAGLAVRVEPAAPADRARARVVVTAAADWDGAPTFVVLETDVEGEERVAIPVRRAGR